MAISLPGTEGFKDSSGHGVVLPLEKDHDDEDEEDSDDDDSDEEDDDDDIMARRVVPGKASAVCRRLGNLYA